MTLNAHFDGQEIVLDEPVPAGLAANTPVKVVIDEPSEESAFDKMAQMAIKAGMPPDYSAQHDHYVKGLPKR